MKKKNGFTFVELLAVMTILGILLLVALPTIEKMTKENKEKVYQKQLDNIVLSLKSWASDNREYLPEKENETLTITLGNLKADGYIEYEVKNPNTGNCFDNEMALVITRVKKNYDYAIDLNTIKESDECQVDINSPIIVLNGNVVENIEVNSVYVDKGASAKDKNGNDITNSVITTISGSSNVVDTSRIGNQYVITYTVKTSDDTYSISRTVKIVDSEAPIINLPGNVLLTTADTTYDIMNGVSASDNSGESITVSAKSNITFGIPGKYTITYTATDGSGNSIVQRRMVIINKVVNGYMSADNNCIKDTNSVCPSGTKVNVLVNATQNYDFYVISDTGSKLTLIMDRNLGNNVAWYEPAPDNSQGPITAMNYLDSLTDEEWYNIPTFEYVYSGMAEDGTTMKYNDITIRMRARMIMDEEVVSKEIGCKHGVVDSCPSWLYGGTNYWTSTADASSSENAWIVHSNGSMTARHVHNVTNGGIRPVIEISK